MNAEVQNVGAASEAAVAAQNANETISFADKAKEMACKVCESVKEFAHEVWEDEEGRKVVTDLAVALGIRLAVRHPLTAGIALGVMGCRLWQEIKATKEAFNNR